MRPFLFFLIIIISTILLSTEKENSNKIINQANSKSENNSKNKSLNKTENIKSENSTSNKTEKKKTKNTKIPKKKIPPPNFTSSDYNLTNVSNNEIYSLNDITFDMVLQKGNTYKWFVILYSETCGHCEFARRELRKIFSQYKKVNNKICRN